ncbi:hypothetical protein [Dialister invisus]|uniref:hypothetical protein n=1 Tax=Dialister invisus TaxID=218538 RepID=UPI00351FA035
MYRKITQEKLLKRYKCFQAPMDSMYPILRRRFSPEYYLTNPTNGWLADVYVFNNVAIIIGYKPCGRHINKVWLKELGDSFWGTLSATERPKIVIHFIQKLQGENDNGTY